MNGFTARSEARTEKRTVTWQRLRKMMGYRSESSPGIDTNKPIFLQASLVPANSMNSMAKATPQICEDTFIRRERFKSTLSWVACQHEHEERVRGLRQEGNFSRIVIIKPIIRPSNVPDDLKLDASWWLSDTDSLPGVIENRLNSMCRKCILPVVPSVGQLHHI